ncbi:MAG: STAS domain-containing protein [bacterium]
MKITTNDQSTVCQFSLRLDTNVAYQLEPQIDNATQPGKQLIFDFSEVDYISSTFLRICVKKWKELGQDLFWIRNPKPDIKRVFKIAGLERLIKD